MEVIRYVHQADPLPEARLGVLIEDRRTIIDLQAAHLSMRGGPSPWLRDLETFQAGGEAARHVSEDVVSWVLTQRPPGTTTRVEDVRLLE